MCSTWNTPCQGDARGAVSHPEQSPGRAIQRVLLVATYQLFVDDSGNREYDEGRDYVHSGKTLYFVYGSILIEERAAYLLVARLRELKQVVFGRTDVELKSNWLRLPEERQRRYIDPFDVTGQRLDRFTDDYYELLTQTPLELVGAVVNKLEVQEEYDDPWYAPTIAYEILLQRAVQAVPPRSTLAVVVDDISGKTPKRNSYQTLLTNHHSLLRRAGSSLQPTISFGCIDSPVRFVSSQKSELIQAADQVAYNIFRQFRDHGPLWEVVPPAGGVLPTYLPFDKLVQKFRTDAAGRVQGFGIVKFPLKKRVQWRAQGRVGNVAAP